MSTTTMERTKREDYPTCDDFPSLSGKQTPLNLREAPGIHEHGRKNIELSRRVGLTAFPWQCHEINAINATNPDGTWVHSDAVLICPRQNGKSLLVALIVIYRIFVLARTFFLLLSSGRLRKSCGSRRGRLFVVASSCRSWSRRRRARRGVALSSSRTVGASCLLPALRMQDVV